MRGQKIKATGADALIANTSSKDTVYIINFWATWCGPCVAELPEFNKLYKAYDGRPVKIILVSLDFKQAYPMKLERFVDKQGLLPQVMWLSDTDPNEYIPKIDNGWQGSIPATVIVSPGSGQKKFIEGSITARDIKKIVAGMVP